MKSARTLLPAIQAAVLAVSFAVSPASASAQVVMGSAMKVSHQADRLLRLDIGDRVYVRGIFSDEPVRVQRIDYSNRRVKVIRPVEETSRWVRAAAVITKEESAVNSAVRVIGTLAVLACLIDLEACEKAMARK